MPAIRIMGVILVFCFSYAIAAQTGPEIRTNLGGYPVDMSKKALILSHKALDKPILLLKNGAGDLIREYPGTKSVQSWAPFAHYYTVDFSDFREKGKYYLELESQGIQSEHFFVGSYPKWQEDVIDFIRTQRCGFNPYSMEFCHQRDGLSFFGIRPDSTRIDATGGWHDAGDQLKYLITGSNTTARMLMAYQMSILLFR